MSSIPSAVAQEAARVEPGLGERREPLQTRLGFTASGSEYFRIWIVNLLLTLGTLGLYYPWARVRKLRYF